jgi:Protein of unknown function (DUF3102)
MTTKTKKATRKNSIQKTTESKHRTGKVKIVGFNYPVLPRDLAKMAQEAAGRIKSGMNKSLIEIGKDLRLVRKELRHGMFGKWIRAEFGMTVRTAQRYMRAARLAEKSDSVSLLPPAALHALSAPTTPARAQEKALERLDEGKELGRTEVTKLIREERKNEADGLTDGADKREEPANRDKSIPSKIVIRLTPRIRKMLRTRHVPADRESFLAVIHPEGDHYVAHALEPIGRTAGGRSK